MSAPVIRGDDGQNRRAFSADDVRRMIEAGILGEDDTFELIDGELIEMSPKGYAHDRVKMALATELIGAVDRRTLYVAVECTLRLQAKTLVEPDIMVCPEAAVRRSPEGYAEVAGTAILLVIEVADSSLRFDKRRKAPLYAGFGIREYWIVDLVERQVIVHREPEPSGYTDVKTVSATMVAVPAATELAAFRVRLAEHL